VSPLLAVPVAVNDVDVATPTGRAVMVLGFMTYFVLVCGADGRLYLAIDSTAGERERGSLGGAAQPAGGAASLVGGKILATCAYMCMSLAIEPHGIRVRVSFRAAGAARHERQPRRGHRADFFAICLPFVPLGAALMTFVASFTRSYREAQTYLTTCCWSYRPCPSHSPAFIR
jgi:sodium transport system permease protein